MTRIVRMRRVVWPVIVLALVAAVWPAGVRASALRPVPHAAADPLPVTVRYNLAYGPLDVEKADVYNPGGQVLPAAAVLIVHGGGWHAGSKGGWGPQAKQLAAAGFVVVVVNYQLATPTAPSDPQALHQLKSAVAWMRSDAVDLKIDPARIGAMGSSAGGNLTAMLATDASGPLDTGTRIRAAVTWSAILDLNSSGLSGAKSEYTGCSSDCTAVYSEASPIHHVSTGDTPMELFNSSHELVRMSDVNAMDARLTHSGVFHKVVIYEGTAHGESYSDKAMPDTIAFFQQQLS